jgi:hypothetical protein
MVGCSCTSVQGGVIRADKNVYRDITPILAQLTYIDIKIVAWVDNGDHWLITVAT